MKKDSNFNFLNTKENKIEYCFSRLLFYTEYLNINLEYKHINYEISIILIYIKKWLKTYIKFKSLKDIDNSDIDKVLKIIDDLFASKKINKKCVEILELYNFVKELIILKTNSGINMQKDNNHKIKSQIFYEKNFNIKLVNHQNIEYAFSQTIFYLEYLILDEEYSYLKQDIKKILNYVKKWLKIYAKQRTLVYIDHKELIKVYNNIQELYYKKEDSYPVKIRITIDWIWAIICLRKTEIDNIKEI